MNTLIHAAAHYAIYAAPVRSGEQGQALLVSLLLSMNSRDACADLLSLYRAGAVELIRRDDIDTSSVARSLRERKIPQDILDQSDLRDGQRRYAALVVTARAATADTVRDHVIRCMRGWIGNHIDDNAAEHLRLAYDVALGERKSDLLQQSAREFCAKQWNRYAGVL